MNANTPEAWFNTGITHIRDGDYPAAEHCFRNTLILAPTSVETLLNLGFALDMQGRATESLACYESVLALSPENPKARYNKAAHLLRAGKLLEGFADYEARFSAMPNADSRIYPQPRWDGSPLHGRTILVYCEQGLGDALQFCRYIPLIAEMGGRVILEAQQPLISLLASVRGVERVVLKSGTPPATDLQIPLLSLPSLFRTTLETIPADVPYLTAPTASLEDWSRRIGRNHDTFRVGMAWAGKAHPYPNRSCPPELLTPLLDVPGVTFYSLQIGETDRFPFPREHADRLIDLTADIADFADTAALITNLDLVITIDTALAHLAGALGRPVWVMLPAASDWRWLEDREFSPWYPTMRLFRQPSPGAWSPVIADMETLLRATRSTEILTTEPTDTSPEYILRQALNSLDLNAPERAISLLTSLLTADADEPALWFNLGRAHEMAGRLTEAYTCFLQALRLHPDSPDILHAAGKVLLKREVFPQAESFLNKAHELRPESVDILLDLSLSQVQQKKIAETFDCCRKILDIDPNNSAAVSNRAFLRLATGDYVGGFADFEARLAIEKFRIDQRTYPQPRWDGSPLNGRTILVFGEQGMGDVIQFARYLPLVIERGGKVTLEVDPPLVALFSSFPSLTQVVRKSDTPPATDLYIPLMSLPHIFGTTLHTIPGQIPYITPDPEKVARWHHTLANIPRPRIGLVWRGNPRNPLDRKRSCPTEVFSMLLDVQGASFFSLQLQADIAPLGTGSELIDYTGDFHDFSDTAAFISQLDLVIGIDTAVTHLAGAMGKPFWVLLPHVYDWRWLIDRNDSPWYPTARVFWQERHNDWPGVIAQVMCALRQWLDVPTDTSPPLDIEACYRTGSQLKEDGDLAGAERCFRQIVAVEPDLPDPQHSLGVVLQMQKRFTEAIEHYRAAIALDPAFIKARYNLAVACWRSGAYQESIAAARAAIAYAPDHREAHWLYGMLLLMSGNFPEGWQEYEFRWGASAGPPNPPELGRPEWDGAPLQGKTLLIHMEQGCGDMLQFIRYAPLAAARGGRVVVCALKTLISLVATVPGVSLVVDRNGPLPAFDLHIPVMSLPRVMGTTLDTIPATVPYIYPQQEDVAAWRTKLADDPPGFRIGLVWQGNEEPDPNRSCPLAQLAELATLFSVRLYSLQVGEHALSHASTPPGFEIIDHTDDIKDFSDTAALIANLDLVVTIDTAVAHLAGAIGKQVWTLLPFVPDWRWMTDRVDSPWYPTMRLYRQRRLGDWKEVVGRVCQDLSRLLADSCSYNQQGIELMRSGRVNDAIAAFGLAIAANHCNADAYCNKGVALEAVGRLEDAGEAMRQALVYRPEYVQAHFNLGNICRSLSRTDEARTYYENALKLDPFLVPAHLCLGEIAKEQRAWGLALMHYRNALALDASCVDALQGIAETYHGQENFLEALQYYQQVLTLAPSRVSVLNLLGTVHHCLGQLEDAERCYRRAVSLAPGKPVALNNLGTVLNAQERYGEAITVFRHLLEIAPDYADGHWNLSMSLLAAGNYQEGWWEYEWRFIKSLPVTVRAFSQPRWDGSPLMGKTILLHSEQGFGDTFQFARYAPLVAARGGKVIIECQTPALQRLMLSLKDVSAVVAAGDPLPHFDCHIPLLSLPLIFDTTLASVPAEVPYLSPDPNDLQQWSQLLGPRNSFRIGLVWFGRQNQVLNRKRSCPLSFFSPLASVPGCEFYTLQIGEGVDQLADLRDFTVTDLTAHITDFADTAAFIASLDLVVTIDTAVAHLAGAVGCPTWVLLPFGADWRWLHRRTDSPWYPTMRLFRQPALGDWHSVISSVRDALCSTVEARQPSSCVTISLPISTPPAKPPSATPPVIVPSLTASPSRLRVGVAWSGRQDNPLNRKRSCPLSALAPLFAVPGVDFFSLQLDHASHEEFSASPLIDLTDLIHDFEDTAALLLSLDLVITIDTAVAHLAGALGRPTWLLLSHVADWRWLKGRDDSPWYPTFTLFRQREMGNWADPVEEAASRLARLVGAPPGKPAGEHRTFTFPPGPGERRSLEMVLDTNRRALALNPDSPDALLDVGAALALLGRDLEAEQFFRNVLQQNPEHIGAHLNLAYALLIRENYAEGWEHFEWRRGRIKPGQLPPWPLLTKETFGQHERGTSLLVHCEQGFGDTIQCARFLPMLALHGYEIVVSCQPPLASLVSSVNGVAKVVEHGKPLPTCARQTMLLSLPYLLGVTGETITVPIPYLMPSSSKLTEWEKRANNDFR